MSTEYEDSMERVALDLRDLINMYEEACNKSKVLEARDIQMQIGELAILFHDEIEAGLCKLTDWE